MSSAVEVAAEAIHPGGTIIHLVEAINPAGTIIHLVVLAKGNIINPGIFRFVG